MGRLCLRAGSDSGLGWEAALVGPIAGCDQGRDRREICRRSG
ncbi:hypothetical protein FraQA3DRAFT_4220 [Frankia sp. QA3]|nr:hypothetical protein FraQA3DRAFT_4220 [Frankia sp. QA3]